MEYCIELRHAGYSTFVLSFLIFFGITSIAGEVIYIVPSPNEPCPAQPCITISQLAMNTNDYMDINNTLAFLPGNHSLYYELAVENVSTVRIINSMPTLRTVVTCINCTGFVFSKIYQVHISGLEVIGCGGSKFESVDQFMFDNCSYYGQKNKCGSGLDLVNVNAKLTNTSFISNLYGSEQTLQNLCREGYFEQNCKWYGGGAVSLSKSNIIISNSVFEGNSAEVGGAIVGTLHSSITIISSTFIENQALCKTFNLVCLGGVVYCEAGCTLSVYNSFFFNNSAHSGGVFSLVMSTLFLTNDHFEWNRAENHGGVIFALKTDISINKNFFSDNQAEFGGVVHVERSTSVDISESNFTQNIAESMGGVLYVENVTTVSINKDNFVNNLAPSIGGAMYGDDTGVYVRNSLFMNNVGIVGGAFALIDCKISLKQCALISNVGEYGGAVYASDSTVFSTDNYLDSTSHRGASETTVVAEFMECKFIDNKAHAHGGALCLEMVNANIDGSSFNSNTGYHGGAIYLRLYSHVNISYSTFTNHEAASGGGIHSENYTTVMIFGLVAIENNKGDLGIIYLQDNIANFAGSV